MKYRKYLNNSLISFSVASNGILRTTILLVVCSFSEARFRDVFGALKKKKKSYNQHVDQIRVTTFTFYAPVGFHYIKCALYKGKKGKRRKVLKSKY